MTRPATLQNQCLVSRSGISSLPGSTKLSMLTINTMQTRRRHIVCPVPQMAHRHNANGSRSLRAVKILAGYGCQLNATLTSGHSCTQLAAQTRHVGHTAVGRRDWVPSPVLNARPNLPPALQMVRRKHQAPRKSHRGRQRPRASRLCLRPALHWTWPLLQRPTEPESASALCAGQGGGSASSGTCALEGRRRPRTPPWPSGQPSVPAHRWQRLVRPRPPVHWPALRTGRQQRLLQLQLQRALQPQRRRMLSL